MKRFLDALLAAGTTTCQAFTSSSPVATEELFEEAARRNMRVIAGLTGIDRNAPAEFIDTPENFYRDSKRLIAQYHNKGRNLYAITPRFAFGASPELLKACQRLKHEHPDCWVNTHISENPAECSGVLVEHPDCQDYLGVYEKFDLVGRSSPAATVSISRTTSSTACRRRAPRWCLPVLEPVPRQRPVPPRPRHRSRASREDVVRHRRRRRQPLLDDLRARRRLQGRHVQQHDARRQHRSGAQGSCGSRAQQALAYRGFWSVTLGGAEGLYIDDKLGNFEPGKEADFVALDPNGGQLAQPWHQSLIADGAGPRTVDDAANMLFSVMMVGDDRCVDETWVMGKRLYKQS
ncbi:amidohydrolase family protein [Bradyrhizobium japonicum]